VDSLFAACAPGLETLLAGELTELGLLKPKLLLGPPAEPGGVAFPGGAAQMRLANLRSCLAERVLVRHGPFPAGDFAALEAASALVPWESYLPPGAPLAVRVESRGSKLYHEKGIAERVARGAGLRLKRPVDLVAWDEARTPPLAYVRVEEDEAVVGVDSSGVPLHRRAWRQAGAKAPLRETLAAALLRASGWDGKAPLLDPFCGSGTIVIEAARKAAGIAAGRDRQFGFQRWPGYDSAAFEKEKTAAVAGTAPVLIGSDRDAGAVAAAASNAARAGVTPLVRFLEKAVSAVEPPPGPGFVVTNPPYGVRVSEGKDLRDLYASFGKVLSSRCAGWRVALLAPPGPLVRSTGLKLDPGLATMNGGLSVTVWTGRV
jgi:putative N6-adenine-specific DNA methylase